MPARKSFVKPEKSNLLVNKGQRETPGEMMAGMKGGEARTETSRYYPKKHVPIIEEPEVLDEEGVTRRRAIISLLTKVIMPNSLSSKSTDIADKRSLVNKLNRTELKQLKGLIPDRIKRMSAEKLQALVDGTEEVPDDEAVEMQTLYMNASP